MEILQSNYLPVKTGCKNFIDTFYNLMAESQRLDIAVGYVTVDSLVTLQQTVKQNNITELNLVIGMHYLERFTRMQYNAAMGLNDYLMDNERGQVRLVKSFRYHGKLYSFSDGDGAFAGIIGSNNLGSIVDNYNRIYDTSLLIDDKAQAQSIKDFICCLSNRASDNIKDCDIERFKENDAILAENENVQKADMQEVAECNRKLTKTSFEIPLKGAEVAPCSNLNVSFGTGRKAQNGFIKPRSWYEVELIVPAKVTRLEGYPKPETMDAVFQVITDDGWKFSCKVSGDGGKNLRSVNDLQILGRWLKGRLVDKGILTVGAPVTNDMLKQYGRTVLTLTKTFLPNIWYLDFGVKQ